MADDSEQIGQDEIEALLRQSSGGETPTPPPAEEKPTEDVSLGQDDIEALMAGASTPATPPPAQEDASLGQGDIEALMAGAATPATPPPAQEDVALGQGDIEALMAGASAPAPPAAAAPPVQPPPPAQAPAAAVNQPIVEQSDIEVLLQQAEEAIASIDQPVVEPVPGIKSYTLEDFTGTPPSQEVATLDLMRDVHLDVRIELGRTHMHLEDVLKLQKNAVVPLDKLAGDPVDIFVNGRLIARGEVLVLNDNFCVRIAELIIGEAA